MPMARICCGRGSVNRYTRTDLFTSSKVSLVRLVLTAIDVMSCFNHHEM